jgi:succinate-semialdehyde dehydrogenase / glutarate-semialdehyde dehydrogenase
VRTQLFVGGKWVDSSSGSVFAVIDPSCGVLIAEVASGTAADATAAVDAAAAAQPSWAAIAPRGRSEVLRTCSERLLGAADELSDLIVREHGKPLAEARGEIGYAAEFFRWNAEETVRLAGQMYRAPNGGNRFLVHHPPVGVVAMITPWNFPAAMITRKVAPALGAGNAVVIKPAPDAPLTALRLAELLTEAGVPPGVVNVVPSDSAQEWLDATIDHRAVRMLSFTGSTGVGQHLLRRCSDRVLKVAMELGGNAPFVVLADADIEAAVDGAMVAKTRHSAETCVAANRFFVESSVVEQFTELLVGRMSKLHVGRGFDDDVTCGPLINQRAVDKTDRLVAAAVADGARVELGGHALDRPGFFYAPTVLSGVVAGSAVTREELFAPVAPIVAFDDEEDMLSSVNDTEMGLAGYVYGADLSRSLRLAERIECGMIGINRGYMSDPAAPFGGMKQSGLGREGGRDGIYEFCETQFVAVDW